MHKLARSKGGAKAEQRWLLFAECDKCVERILSECKNHVERIPLMCSNLNGAKGAFLVAFLAECKNYVERIPLMCSNLNGADGADSTAWIYKVQYVEGPKTGPE